jgi:large subunit ribosomal protein L30
MADNKSAAAGAAAKKAAGKTAARKSAAAKTAGKKVRVTLVKSVIGTRPAHRATVRGLGLRRLNSSVELIDTPEVRGMINRVFYLVKCEG